MMKTHRKILALAVMFGVLVIGTGLGSAASLWVDNTSTSSLYGDKRARAVGDIITIVVSESSTIARTGTATNSKTATTEATKPVGDFGPLLNWAKNFLPSYTEGGTTDSFKSSGTLNNSNTVKARITVQVTEVRPNGNLVVSGSQMIKQNNEEQKITVTGVIRPDDILSDNSILSSNVADAKIDVYGKGQVANKQRQGILTQIWNFLF